MRGLYGLVLLWIPIVLSQNFIDRCLSGIQAVYCTSRDDQRPVTLPGDIKVVSDCHFYGCGQIIVRSPTRFTNISFSHHTSGAVLVQNTTVWLDQVTFRNCTTKRSGASVYATSASRVFMHHSSITLGRGYSGGAIFMESATHLVVTQSHFINNTATLSGGSIYVSQYSHLTMNDSYFINGQAGEQGGDVFLAHSVFEWNRGMCVSGMNQLNAKQGGCLYSVNCTTHLENVDIQGYTVSQQGGALVLLGGTHGIENMTLDSNRALEQGGAILVDGGSRCVGKNITVRYSFAQRGGAFAITRSSWFNLTASLIHHSYANTSSGAMLIEDAARVRLHDTVISNTSVIWTPKRKDAGIFIAHGGAISLVQSYLELDQVVIQGCRCEYMGGGIVMAASTAHIQNVVLKNNVAGEFGGAVFSVDTQAIYKNVDFINNTALTDGGALLVYFEKAFNHTWTRFQGTIQFLDNKAMRRGGAISLFLYGKLSIETSSLIVLNNTAITGSSIESRQIITGPYAGDIQCHTNTSIKMDGIVWVEDEPFSRYLAQQRICHDHVIQWDTRVALIQLVPLSSSNESLLPDFNVSLLNMFGMPLRSVNMTSPPIVSIDFKIENTTRMVISKGFTTYSRPWRFTRDIKRQLVKHMQNQTQVTLVFTVATLQYEAAAHIEGYQGDFSLTSLVWTERHNNLKTLDLHPVTCLPSQYPWDPLQTGQVTCLRALSVPSSWRMAAFILTLFLIIMTLGLQVYAYLHRQAAILRLFSSYFVLCCSLGLLIQLSSILVRWTVSSEACMAVRWLDLLGFTMACTSLLLKTHRIRAIFLKPLDLPGHFQFFSNAQLSLVLMAVMLFITGFLIVWTLVDQDRVMAMYRFNTMVWIQTDACHSSIIFTWMDISFRLVLCFTTLSLAHDIRHIRKSHNDSLRVLVMTASWIVCINIGWAMEQFLVLQPHVLFVVHCLQSGLPALIGILALHVPSTAVIVLDPLGPKANLKRLYTTSNASTQEMSSISIVSSVITRSFTGLPTSIETSFKHTTHY